MARPIKETPTLKGKEAVVFEQKISNPRPVTREAVEAAREAYNNVISIAKFNF